MNYNERRKYERQWGNAGNAAKEVNLRGNGCHTTGKKWEEESESVNRVNSQAPDVDLKHSLSPTTYVSVRKLHNYSFH